MKMKADHKRALAIIFNKKVNITTDDLTGIFMTGPARKNALEMFHKMGFLTKESSGFLCVNEAARMDIIKELSE